MGKLTAGFRGCRTNPDSVCIILSRLEDSEKKQFRDERGLGCHARHGKNGHKRVMQTIVAVYYSFFLFLKTDCRQKRNTKGRFDDLTK